MTSSNKAHEMYKKMFSESAGGEAVRQYRLIKHNSDVHLNHGGCGFADTRKSLEVGKKYIGYEEVFEWHTKIWIDNQPFNSVCFEEVKP